MLRVARPRRPPQCFAWPDPAGRRRFQGIAGRSNIEYSYSCSSSWIRILSRTKDEYEDDDEDEKNQIKSHAYALGLIWNYDYRCIYFDQSYCFDASFCKASRRISNDERRMTKVGIALRGVGATTPTSRRLHEIFFKTDRIHSFDVGCWTFISFYLDQTGRSRRCS
jgi:hypothetical protein